MSRPRVVVVGGGLAGLSAAIGCADAGLRVTLLERRSRLGGATWSRRHRGLGIDVDNGQHVFMRCCDRYRRLLERFGVTDRVYLQPRLAVPVARPGLPISWIRRSALPAPLHLASSLLRYRPLSLRERLRAARTARAFARLDPDDPALDERSLGDWLDEQGETPAAVDALWELLVRSTLNAPAREASLALAARVMRTGLLETAGGADLGWSRVPLNALHAEPAARILTLAGARVHLRTSVEKIEVVGPRSVRLRAGGHGFDAEAVVLAAPHDEAARLLPASARRAAPPLEELGHAAIVNLHVVFDRKVMDTPLLAGIDSPLQWIFDRTESSGLTRGQYLTVSLSAGEAYLGRSHAALRATFVPAFHALLPRTRDARIEGFAVGCERMATFRQAPGTRKLRPTPGAAVGAVHLAGAWTDTGWPATMEGAVRSGEAAARSVVQALAPERIRAPARASRHDAVSDGPFTRRQGSEEEIS